MLQQFVEGFAYLLFERIVFLLIEVLMLNL
jgi:hypothetical protein